jgi:Spondin_N
MKRLLPALLLALLGAALLIGPAAANGDDDDDDGGRPKAYRVTVENLTPAGSQPLSPPLLVVHSSRADVWSVGDIASHGVAAIAEDANNTVLESALTGFPGVRSVETGAGGPIPPGGSGSYVVETAGRFNRVSLLTMLVNTNDAFTGLDSLRVHGGRTVLATGAYDAGSERNNELESHIPGPCCNNPFVRDPEGRVIQMHEGIKGVGDLSPATYGWTGPAARITIERVS